MVPKWREKVRELLGGRIEGAPPEALVRVVQEAAPARRARALRELGARDHPEVVACVQQGLTDPVPGVRRAAAWAAGWSGRAEVGWHGCAGTLSEIAVDVVSLYALEMVGL